jgi:hypothetical protein
MKYAVEMGSVPVTCTPSSIKMVQAFSMEVALESDVDYHKDHDMGILSALNHATVSYPLYWSCFPLHNSATDVSL